jgi:hypothetical protein
MPALVYSGNFWRLVGELRAARIEDSARQSANEASIAYSIEQSRKVIDDTWAMIAVADRLLRSG